MKLFIVTDESWVNGVNDGYLIGMFTRERKANNAVKEIEGYWQKKGGKSAKGHNVSYYTFQGEVDALYYPDGTVVEVPDNPELEEEENAESEDEEPMLRLFAVTDESWSNGENEGCLIGVFSREYKAEQVVQAVEAFWTKKGGAKQASTHNVSYYEFDSALDSICYPEGQVVEIEDGFVSDPQEGQGS